jgi:formate dehydrogenase iron-sulfur subunit
MMEVDRRTFIRLAGATVGALMLPSDIALAASLPRAFEGEGKGMLVDLVRCVGCGWCQKACQEWNHLSGKARCPDGVSAELSADTWTAAQYHQFEVDGRPYRVFVKRQCMHCLHPACVSACPVGALRRAESGAVLYDASRCIGCRYCMVACPFGVPKFQWDEALPTICKCTFCADRQEEGLAPACSSACPTGALTFGDRRTLIAEAQARILAAPDTYVAHIYGQEEGGGTSWIYLSPVPFEELGFPTVEPEAVTGLSEAVATFGTVGMATSVTAVLAGAYYWFGRRKDEGPALDFARPEEGEQGQ